MSTVQVKYSTASDLSGAATTAGFVPGSAADFTGALDIAGLTAGTTYYYTILIDGADQLSAPYPSFKTFPSSGSSAAFSFAFGSCTKHADTIGADTIFDAVPSDVAFLMHLGDAIYADRDTPTTTVLSGYRAKHQAVLAGSDSTSAGFKALRKRTPVFTMLDDHDIVNDADGSVSRTVVDDAKQAFAEYPARANPDSMTAGELYYAFQIGDVGFFVADLRTMRSSNSATDNASKTILGNTQKAALKSWLLANKTALKLKFICASTPMHGYAANTGNDSWGGVDDGTQAPNGSNGFRTERNEIWDYIDTNEIPGVVVISGDQHWAGSFKTTYAGRPRYEFMATPFNMTNNATFMLDEVARAADPVNGPVLWKLDQTMNFGLVTVDTTANPATVSFQLYGISGSLGASYLTEITADDIDVDLVKPPAVLVSATFPSNPHVGDVVSFDVIATLAHGATGTLTITVDQLPAGLSLGATSMVDATHYKATVSGTLTTVQDITSTFGATGGSVAATGLVHEFNVTAAASSPVVVQQKYGQGGTGSQTMTFTATPTAGNTMLIAMAGATDGPPATPTGWTAVDDVAITGSTRHWYWFKRVSDGTETGVTVTWGGSHTFNSFGFQEWEGSVSFSGGECTYLNGPGTAPTVGPTAAPPDASAAPSMSVFLNSSNAGVAIAAPWTTNLPPINSQAYNACVPATRDPTGDAVTLPITWTTAPSFIYWSNIWVSKA